MTPIRFEPGEESIVDTDDANDAVVFDFVDKMWKLNNRETEDCIHCGKHIDRMEQIGRCTYARPCGCRLWQGKIPDAWKGSNK